MVPLVSVLSRAFLGLPVHVFTAYLSGTEGPLPWLGALAENVLELEVSILA